jgi:transposase
MLDMPCCNSNCFKSYLDEFSLEKPTEFKIIILDNGAFHDARRLIIPANIGLVFLPPYSPELNPAEKM